MSDHDTNAQDSPPAGDLDLASALAEANVPALMLALVHLTGDLDLIRGEIKPDLESFEDQQCGISAELQAKARDQASSIVTDCGDLATARTVDLDDEAVQEMIRWMIGVDLPPEYTDFLVAELAMDGSDPYAVPTLDDLPPQASAAFHVVVIGAGMSGLLAARRLHEAGIRYTVIEKNAEVGGTWYENTYPGCRVDSPNHTYSYSFRAHSWPNFFSPGPVLRDYFDQCADEFDVRPNLMLSTNVERAEWNEDQQRWSVTVDRDGKQSVIEANAVIAAVGQLNQPKSPDIDGLGTFEGPCFHSARWDHSIDLRGKRVGVIGTGASAFQFIPEIADAAASVTVFQRTPPWVRPTPDYHALVPAGKHWLLDNVPYYAKWYRFLMFWLTAEGMLEAAKVDPEWDNGGLSVSQANEDLRQLLLGNLQECLQGDPELLARCTPAYPPAGKRMLFDNGTWFKTLQSDNVTLVTDPITHVSPEGPVTHGDTGPQQTEVDVLILGTGFKTSEMLSSFEVKGRGDRSLQQIWRDDPQAYLGITVPQHPNFFCLYGPNTNIVVNGSIIFFSECEVRYVMTCLAHLIAQGHGSMDCKEDRLATYIEAIDAGNQAMAWGSPSVRSWYKNEAGRVTQNWPFSLVEYWNQTKGLDADDYHFR